MRNRRDWELVLAGRSVREALFVCSFVFPPAGCEGLAMIGVGVGLAGVAGRLQRSSPTEGHALSRRSGGGATLPHTIAIHYTGHLPSGLGGMKGLLDQQAS